MTTLCSILRLAAPRVYPWNYRKMPASLPAGKRKGRAVEPAPLVLLLYRDRRYRSAVVGSMIALTSATELAGKPPWRACSRTSSSFGAMYTQ